MVAIQRVRLSKHWLCSLVLLVGNYSGLSKSVDAQPVATSLGPAEPLPQTLYTFNTNLLTATAFHGMSYDGPAFEAAIRELRPQGLRFPGGTIANNYLWQSDSFSEPVDDRTGWAGEQLRLFRKIGRPYDLPGFARVCRRFDLAPIYVLNVYAETPKSVVSLLKFFDEIGFHVGAIELANEPYWDGRSFNNVQRYICYCRPLAAALKEHRPQIRLGACFAPLGKGFDYERKWNAVLAREEWFDAAIYHEYYGGQGFALDEGAPVPVEAMLHPEAMVDKPVDALRELMPGKPIWFTEWNAGSKALDHWKNTGAELLYIATTFIRLLEHRDAIEWACFHEIYGGKFGAFEFDAASGHSETMASWQLFRLLGTTFVGASQLRPVTFETGDLRGFATQDRDDVRLFVLNRGATEQSITLSPEMGHDAMRLTIACPPESRLPTSRALAEEFDVTTGTVTLPPCSVSLIGRRTALTFAPESTANRNLFPRRPHLTLWYPPYASHQPRFDVEGVYTVDLAGLDDKPLAVVKMDVASLKLEAGREYVLDFEVRATPDSGLVVKLPTAARHEASDAGPETGTHFTPAGQEFGRRRYAFRYDPEANEGEVSLVITKEVLDKSGMISLRNFVIAAGDLPPARTEE